MEIIRVGGKECPCVRGTAVTALGFFDGVHLGHRRLFDATVAEAARRGPDTYAAVFTFSDDARQIKAGAARLTDFETKMRLLREAGIKRVYVADFPSVMGLSAESFVCEILVRQCKTVYAVCGFNFRFGRGASGDASALCSLMQQAGGDATVIPPAYLGGQVISSSAIRTAIESGDMLHATAMLGRPFSLTAPVVRGRGYGHSEGVPTINQVFSESGILPRSGVYACRARLSDGTEVAAVANVGSCPTFAEKGEIHCETHLIGYSGDLYGKTLTVDFLYYLRPEKRFDSAAQLYAQIGCDIQMARALTAPSGAQGKDG